MTAATDPDTGLDALIAAGRVHRAAGELDEAVTLFTSAHQRYPDAARPLVERGAILILHQRYAESRADYAAAATMQPNYPGLQSYVAELDLYTGRAAQALALSRAAVQVEPDDLMHRINIAHSLALLGDTSAALESYRAVAGRFHPGKGRTGADLALQDLQLLSRADIDVPRLDEITAALTST